MTITKMRRNASAALLGSLVLVACSNEEKPPTRVAPPSAASASAAVVKQGEATFAVASEGTASFLIDAPLEKIQGNATTFRGTLTADPQRLDSLRGQVDVDLGSLETETFDDAKKNAKQTAHARNWLELGPDVAAKTRAENQWARFTLRSVKFTPSALSAAAEVDGKRKLAVAAEGDFWLHGVTVPKAVKLAATFEGPVAAPRLIAIETTEPMGVSLKEHDVKPRDITGQFLQGALERVGDKIVDDVQISLRFRAQAVK